MTWIGKDNPVSSIMIHEIALWLMLEMESGR